MNCINSIIIEGRVVSYDGSKNIKVASSRIFKNNDGTTIEHWATFKVSANCYIPSDLRIGKWVRVVGYLDMDEETKDVWIVAEWIEETNRKEKSNG